MCKMNYFSLFWKSYLVLFLTFITALQSYAVPLVQDAGVRTNSFDLVKIMEKSVEIWAKFRKTFTKSLKILANA